MTQRITLLYSEWKIGQAILGKCQCVACYRAYCREKWSIR